MGDETVSEKKRCVIVGGADIGDYAHVKQYLRADDAIVFSQRSFLLLKF